MRPFSPDMGMFQRLSGESKSDFCGSAFNPRSLRKCTVEPVIGIIKEILGFRQFSLRGLLAAAGEWVLVCLAFNIKRMHILWIEQGLL